MTTACARARVCVCVCDIDSAGHTVTYCVSFAREQFSPENESANFQSSQFLSKLPWSMY